MIKNGNIDSIGGMEFATFRLKEGVTEARLVELSNYSGSPDPDTYLRYTLSKE